MDPAGPASLALRRTISCLGLAPIRSAKPNPISWLVSSCGGRDAVGVFFDTTAEALAVDPRLGLGLGDRLDREPPKRRSEMLDRVDLFDFTDGDGDAARLPLREKAVTSSWSAAFFLDCFLPDLDGGFGGFFL